MVRSVPAICLCCMLLWVSTACAPKYTEFSALSEHGYKMSLDVSESLIRIGPAAPNFPQAAELIVRVRDAQGQPVDGIVVEFSVEPSWAQNATLTPAVARTRHGEARAYFQATTTGVVNVMARVDNVTRNATITVAGRPSTPATST